MTGNKRYLSGNSRFSLITIITVILVGSVLYSNTLGNPFTFDDAIMEKERNTAFLEAAAASNGKVSTFNMITAFMGRTRPVALISFFLNYKLGGDNPPGYHIVNLLIHLLTAVTVYFFILESLHLVRYSGERIAAVTALLFVSHPVQTQAVTYIVQRETSLMALFYLLSMLAYLRGRVSRGSGRAIWFAGSALFALISLGTKQNAVTLPLFLVLYEIYFFQGLNRGKMKIAPFLPLLALPVLIGLIYTRFQLFATLAEGYKGRPFTMGERLITEWRVILHYFSLLLYPHPSRLNLDYHFPFSRSLFAPATAVLGLLVIGGLLGTAVYLMKRRPLISFGIFWFFGQLALESTIYPLDLIYEHRLYLPSIGFFLIISLGLNRLFGFISAQSTLKAEWAVVAVLVMILGWGTYRRNQVWQSEISLWQDVVKKSFNKARPHNNLGKAYAAAALADKSLANLADEAIKEYKKAIELNPKNFVAYDNLGQSYGRKGKTDEAIKSCRQAVKLNPGYLQAYNNLGVAYNKKGMYDLAIKACLKALKIRPNYAKSYFNRGKGYEGKKMYDRAIKAYRTAWSLLPEDANIPYNIGNVYVAKGENGR
ncbi:MAG: tetratricopeptide repeat protein, partial [bacterium]